MGSEMASPQRKDAAVKPAIERSSRRLLPTSVASHPVIGRMMALAARYEVSAHVDSSTEALRLPAMCGSETFTTVVSRTTMNVPNITETATSQGCGSGAFPPFVLISIYLVRTVGTTDMPGRSRWPGSCPLSNTIFTGTRWTTFT